MNSEYLTKKKRQAVIIADSSSQALYPLTADTPLCLLPLANMRVIDYSLYWLASQRFDEIIICCTKFEEEINDYLVNTNWNIENLTRSQTHTGRVKSPLIQLMSMPTCTSTGDILRELDSRGCIESDSFLLVDSGTISNIDLSTVWKEHEERQKKSSYNIMTSIFSHIPVEEDTPRNHEIALIHNDHDRILAYGDIKNMNNFSVITASLLENNQVSVRFDIGQTGIHICSREVLVHFSDNYDYKDIYDDYLAKEVENIEFGYQYYGYFNDNSYARCIKDFSSYRIITDDVISRWCYPMVPDNEICGLYVCPYSKNDIYRHPTAKLSYSTHVIKRCLIEYQSIVEEEVNLKSTTIGAHCFINKGCKISNCIIYDNCTIGENCVLRNCIIGQNTTIGENCIMDRCVLGNNVSINSSIHYDGVKIHNIPYDEEFEEEQLLQWNEKDSLEQAGEGEGYFMKDLCSCSCKLPMKSTQDYWKVSSKGCQGFESDNDEDEVENRDYGRFLQSIEFVRRLEQSEGRDLDDIYTEISCFRMSLNCTYEDILDDLVTILIETIWKKEDTVASYLERTAVNRVTIRLHNSLISKFLIGNITKLTIVNDVAKYAVDHEEFKPFFGYVMQQLWDENVVDITDVETWIGEVDEEDEEMMKLASDNVLKRALDDFNESSSSYDYSYSESSDDSSDESSEESEESESEYSGSESNESGSESNESEYSESESNESEYSESEESESNESDD